MALAANTNARYSQTQAPGTSDDSPQSLMDFVVNSAPMWTPVLAMMTRGKKPINIEHEWVLDNSGAYPTSPTALRRGEGQDFDPAATATRYRMFNRTGIWGYSWYVTDTQEAIDKIGINSELDYQEVKYSRALVRDFEVKVIQANINNDSAGPNTATTASQFREMGGLIQQITTLNSFARNGPVPAVAWGYDHDSSSSVNESDLITPLRTIRDRGGVRGVTTLIMSSAAKVVMSSVFSPFPSGTMPASTATVYRRYYGSDAAYEVALTVDEIATDVGRCHAMIADAVPAATVIGFNPDYFHLNVLRDFTLYDLARVAPAAAQGIEAEMTCSLIMPASAFRITNWA